MMREEDDAGKEDDVCGLWKVQEESFEDRKGWERSSACSNAPIIESISPLRDKSCLLC